MKKNYARLWIIVVFLILTVLCLTAAGADDLWEYRVEDGFAWLTGYKGSEESITVPDQINGIPVIGLSTASIGNSVRDVTIPVTVSEIAPEAIPAGTRVHARHGAAALSWAREHQCTAIDMSKRDFNELIVDLTGSDYQYSPDGISLSPALVRAVHTGQAVYIPETDSAWGITALTEQNGRILLTAEEADPYMTYNSVRIRSATKRGVSGDGLSFDEHGHAIISFSPEANYHFSLPIQQENVVVTQNLDITQLDVNMEVSMGTVIAASSPALLPALIGWNIRDIVTTGGEHTLDLGSLVKRADIDFQWTISTDISISAAGFTLLPDQAIVLEAQLDFTRQIPLGPTPFTLKPFGLLQASANGSYSMTFGIENNRFSMSYTCTNWNGNLSGEGFTFGTPFIESNTVVEATAGIFFGLELGMKPCMSLLTLTAGVEASLSDERAEIENRIGTTWCRDVTWDIYQKGNVTFQPEIDFEIFSSGPGKISVYVQNSIDLTKGFSIGLQYGSNFSGFASWDFAKKRWNIPITISGHEIQAGETAHYEMEESGNWVYREHCQRDHLLAFHTGNPDEEVIYKDCSSFRDWYQFSDTNWTPEQMGKTFQGWYTEAGENFYDENSAYADITAWAGQLDLYASWQDNSAGTSSPDDENNYDYNIAYSAFEGNAEWTLTAHNISDPVAAYSNIINGAYIAYDEVGAEYIKWPYDAEIRFTGHDFRHMYPREILSAMKQIWNSSTKSIYIVEGYGSGTVSSVIYGSRVLESKGYPNSPNLVSVSCSEGMREIGTYYNCPRLQSINIPEGVTYLRDSTFRNCRSLQYITLPESLQAMYGATFENSGLKTITIPSGVTDINDYAFRGCTALESAYLPDTLLYMGTSAFANSGLTAFRCPESVEYIPMQGFENCSLLTEFVFPEHLESIGYEAFRNCFLLQAIDVRAEEIDDRAFCNCTTLKSATLQAGAIGQSVFKGCSSLETLNLIGDVSLSWNVLEDCFNLDTLTVTGGKVSLGQGLRNSFVKNILINAEELKGLSLNNCTELETLVIRADTVSGELNILNCPRLKSVSIETGSGSSFLISNCLTLESISISAESPLPSLSIVSCPQLSVLSVQGETQDIEITGCASLCQIEFGSITDSLTLNNLQGLESIDLQNSVLPDTFIRINFCQYLRELILPDYVDVENKLYLDDCQQASIKRRVSAVSGGNGPAGGIPLHFTSEYGTEHPDILVQPGETVHLFTPERFFRNQGGRLLFDGWILNGNRDNLLHPGDTFTMPDEESTLYAFYQLRFEEGEIDHDAGWLNWYMRPYDQKEEVMIIPWYLDSLAYECIDSQETKVHIHANVRQIDPGAFIRATGLVSITVDPDNEWFYDRDGVLYSRDGTLICVPPQIRQPVLEIEDGTRKIESYAFHGLSESDLMYIVLPDSLEILADGCLDPLQNGTLLYGPSGGSVADQFADASNIHYNFYPVYLISGDAVISMIMAKEGDTLELQPLEGEAFLGWSLSRSGSETIDEVTVPRGGIEIFARWRNNQVPDAAFMLPEGTVIVETEAFSGIAAGSVYITENVHEIQDGAFTSCGHLKNVIFAGKDTVIDDGAFDQSTDILTIYGYAGSTAQEYARDHGYTFVTLWH